MTDPLMRVLGNVRLTGAPDDSLAATKVRSLAALLTLPAGQVVPTERLIDELWDGNPPASASTSLRVHISNLRRVLADQGAGVTVEHHPPGYRLTSTPESLDAGLAERLMRAASCAPADQSLARCDEALRLWSGDEPYADVNLSRLEAERRRLGDLRLALWELRAEARSRLEPADIAFVAELEDLVRRSPTRERFTSLLMEALYRSGREAEAIDAFKRLNSELAELGLVPSRALQDLETAILQQSPTLDWVPLDPAAPSIAVPSAPTTHSTPMSLQRFRGRFVGRVDSLARLRQACQERRDRRGVLVRGEAGIGKTRLVTEFAESAIADGATVVIGNCDREQLVPFRPFFDMIRQLRAAGFDLPAPLITHHDEGGADGRLQYFTTVCEAFETVGDSSPGGFLIIVEDLHWIDEASAALLRFLLGARPALPLFMLGTARCDEPEASRAWSSLRTDWARTEAGISLLDLGGLSVGEAADMMADRRCPTGTTPPADVMHAMTNGNPLLIDELSSDPGIWSEPRFATGRALPVPSTVAETVRHRLELLSATARYVIEAAAVTGDGAPVTIVAGAAEVGRAHAYRHLGQGVNLHLLIEDDARPDAAVFKHPLVRQAVLDALPAPTRLQLHLRVAQAHETHTSEGFDRDLAIARHLIEAVPAAAVEDAADAAAVAAERAVEAFAFEAAGAIVARTFDLPQADTLDPERAHRLWCALGLAHAHLDDHDRVTTAFGRATENARHLDDPERLASAALGGDLPDRTATPTPDREQRLLAALERLDRERHTATRIRVLSALARDGSIPSDYVDRRDLANEAVDLAHRLGQPAELFRALASWYMQHLGYPDADALRAADEMVRLAEITGDPAWSARARLMRARERLSTGDMSGAEADLAEHLALAERTRRPRDRWQAQVIRAALARQRGDFAAAADSATTSAAIGERAGLVETALVHSVHVFFDHFHRGALAELAPALAIDVDRYHTLPVVALGAALAEAQSGRFTNAGAALALATDLRQRDELAPVMLALGTLVAVLAGDNAAMATLDRELEPYAGTVIIVGGLTGTFGPADRYRAMLARYRGAWAVAERLAEEAIGLADRIGATAWSLWSRAERAAALLPIDREAARTLAEQVETEAVALGLGGPAAAAATVRRAAGPDADG